MEPDEIALYALSHPDEVAALVDDEYAVVIGEILPGLWTLGDEPISGLDARSKTALSRLRVITWSDLASRRVGDLWSVPSAGKLTVTRVLSAAAHRNAKEGPTAGRQVVSTEGIAATRTAAGVRLDRVLRELAAWAIRERGARQLSDLVALSSGLGRVAPEIAEAFERLSDFPLEEFVGAAGSSLPASLVGDLLDRLSDDRARSIFVERRIRLEGRPTLEQLGRLVGVTRERVRQLERKVADIAQEVIAEQDFAPLRWRASDLADLLGVAAPRDAEFVIDALEWATRGLDSPDSCAAEEVLLWLAGPYELIDGWLVRSGTSMSDLDRAFAQATSDRDVIDEEFAREVLAALGVSEVACIEFLARTRGWRPIGDSVFVRWSTTIGDKALLVMRLVGGPVALEELNEHIGEGHALGTVRNVLASDTRFVRLDKASNFGLAEWGLEEYSGIAREVGERIDRAGGAVLLEDLVVELVDQFGVSANSVRAYAGSPAFVIESGWVNHRPPDHPYVADDRLDRVNGLYLSRDGRVIVHDVVDRDVLRGSGRSLAEPAAALLGLSPGGRIDFSCGSEIRVVVTWPATSVMGPSLGSVRAVVASLGLVEGDRFRITFDPATETCVGAAVGSGSLRALTGLTFDDADELTVLARALRTDPQTVRSVLQARGDDEVLRLLPEPASVADLGDAIAAFGDLLG